MNTKTVEEKKQMGGCEVCGGKLERCYCIEEGHLTCFKPVSHPTPPTDTHKEEWEEEAQKWMDELSIVDIEILNSIVFHKIQAERERLRKAVEELMPEDKVKALARNLELYGETQMCALCGADPMRQRKMILKILGGFK